MKMTDEEIKSDKKIKRQVNSETMDWWTDRLK